MPITSLPSHLLVFHTAGIATCSNSLTNEKGFCIFHILRSCCVVPRSIRIPSIRLSLRGSTDDSPCRRPDISYRTDSCFHLRFIGLQCLDDMPGDTLNDQIFRAYLFTGINSFVPVKKNRFLILSINAAIHFQRALIIP